MKDLHQMKNEEYNFEVGFPSMSPSLLKIPTRSKIPSQSKVPINKQDSLPELFIGCFKDKERRDLPWFVEFMTTNDCLDACMNE